MPPAGVQKVNVCFTCSSLCSHELDTILSTVAQCPWFGLNPWGSLANAGQGWMGFSPTKLVPRLTLSRLSPIYGTENRRVLIDSPRTRTTTASRCQPSGQRRPLGRASSMNRARWWRRLAATTWVLWTSPKSSCCSPRSAAQRTPSSRSGAPRSCSHPSSTTSRTRCRRTLTALPTVHTASSSSSRWSSTGSFMSTARFVAPAPSLLSCLRFRSPSPHPPSTLSKDRGATTA